MDPELVRALKALPDPTRLRLLGRLAAGAATNDELAEAARVDRPALVRHLERLRAAGLVEDAEERGRAVIRLRHARLVELSRALDALDEQATERAAVTDPLLAGLSAEDAKVVRGYLVDGRLIALPSSDRKRLPVLRWLLDRVFAEDRGYPEKEVNAAIALVHEDVASLRRYLVDFRLVTREGGVYRRVTGRPPAEEPTSGQ